MKIDLVFLIVLGLVVAYVFALYKIETMADVGSLDQIKEAVKQVYLADVEAIRNLSEVATKLQAGGLTVPGQLTTNIINASDNINVSNKTNEGGRIRILNALKNGKADQTSDWSIWNMTGDYGNKLSFWRYNGDGKNAGSALDIFDNGTVNVSNNVVLNTGIQNPNGQLRVSNQGIMFGGPNTDREVNSGQISAGLHIANSLNIVGMSGDKGHTTRRIDMWAEGGLNVYGPLNLGGTTLTEDILKRIINQQSYAGFAVDGTGTTMPLYEGSHNLYGGAQFDAWTNDAWDIIYINRGWRITLWEHALGDTQAAVGENKSSNVPTKLGLPANKVSSYRAEWIGY
jgi:hypothetical protein